MLLFLGEKITNIYMNKSDRMAFFRMSIIFIPQQMLKLSLDGKYKWLETDVQPDVQNYDKTGYRELHHLNYLENMPQIWWRSYQRI